jgi:MoaA/NifB/PqqE/SkfB family radical SAM enzyme
MWPFLQNIGLMMTYKCQVSCPHCIVECSPNRTEEMLESEALDWIRQIAQYRNGYIKVLSLTGGEPLFNIEKFRRMAECAASHGLLVAAVTNAYWAKSPERAVEVLRGLPPIAALSISTDSYHQKWIPIDRVFNAIAAARECSIPCSVAICTESQDDPEYKALLCKLEETIGAENITTVTTLLAGRALVTIQASVYETTPDPAPYCCVPAAAPVIFPDGRVIACIGPLITLKTQHPLVLGNARDTSLEEIFDRAEVNPVLHALRVWGPKKLVEMARAAGLDRELPPAFVEGNVCDACYRIFSRPELAPFLNGLAYDAEFARVTAYGRIFYLKEDEMADRLFGTSVLA